MSIFTTRHDAVKDSSALEAYHLPKLCTRRLNLRNIFPSGTGRQRPTSSIPSVDMPNIFSISCNYHPHVVTDGIELSFIYQPIYPLSRNALSTPFQPSRPRSLGPRDLSRHKWPAPTCRCPIRQIRRLRD